MSTIGEFVKENREKIGLSQRDLSQWTTKMFGKTYNVSHSHISELETGAKGMSLEKVSTLLATLSAFKG